MDERIVNKKDASRESRSSADAERVSADEALTTAEERRKMFREFTQEALPSPTPIPGWHFIWLSTTNQYDPIYKRMRMGYEPVKAEELPDFNHLKIKSGEFEGCISINEMLLFKLPEEVYQEIMYEYHVKRPQEEEQRLKSNVILGDRDSNGKQLGSVEGDGFANLGRHNSPVFN